LLIFSGFVSSYGENNDSLLTIINSNKGEQKIEALLQLSDAIQYDSLELSIKYSRQAIKESEKLSNKNYLIKSLMHCGSMMKNGNELDSAMYFFELAKEEALDERDDKILGAIIYQMATIFELKSE